MIDYYDEEEEWEEILFGTLEEGLMKDLALGTVLAIVAGKALEATGILSNFPVGSAARYELVGAYAATVGLGARYILDVAGEKLARRARRQAAALSDEVQEAIAEGLVNDPKFVKLLDNLKDLSEKVIEIKGKRGKEFQAIRAAKRQAAEDLKDYISSEAALKLPPELAKRARGMSINTKSAGARAKRKYYGIEENKMKFSKSEIKQIIKEEIQQYMDEIIDNNGVEIEEEGPSDEEHLLGLLAKEFDRIPSDKRKSVYTRFLSAANRYADKVSVATPESIPSLQEEFIKEANIGPDFQNFMSSLGKVPQEKQKQLLQKLNDVVEKYVKNLAGGGAPVSTQPIDTTR